MLGTSEPMIKQFGNGPRTFIADDEELKIPCVCSNCNNRWMSKRENKVKEILGPMILDISVFLDSDDQTRLAVWALKTAMVADAARGVTPFYNSLECQSLRSAQRDIPDGTHVWLGRYIGSSRSIKTGGTNLNFADGEIIGNMHVFTIVVGHVIFQVTSMRQLTQRPITSIQMAAREGPWPQSLIQIHPIENKKISWPPPLSFTLYGSNAYGGLVYRWNRPDGHSVTQRVLDGAPVSDDQQGPTTNEPESD